jgi:hypothetical protein
MDERRCCITYILSQIGYITLAPNSVRSVFDIKIRYSTLAPRSVRSVFDIKIRYST